MMATIMTLSVSAAARADENKISPDPVSGGAPFTFSHISRANCRAGVQVTMLYNNNNTPVYRKVITGHFVIIPSNALLIFNFPGGFAIPDAG